MFSIEPTVTKDLLKERNSEEKYMSFYLGVPVTKRLFKSTLRVDNRETCSFYRNSKNELKYHDFGDGSNFNFVEVVMHLHKCGYNKALQIIANDFNIITIPKIQKNTAKAEYNGETILNDGPCVINVETKPFTTKELDWWMSFGITPEILRLGRVFSLKTVFINGFPVHFSSDTKPIYGYFLGHEEDRELWKIYFPTNTKYRFLLNTSRLQGTHMLPKIGDYLIITKSMKDIMTLRSLGYYAVAPQSENSYLKKEQFDVLSKRFTHIIFWYDNDRPGMKALITLRKMFPAYYYFIPKKYGVKDISDFYKKYKEVKSKTLVDNLINEIFTHKLDYHIIKYEKFRNKLWGKK